LTLRLQSDNIDQKRYLAAKTSVGEEKT
jgi:hypothetical protein